MVKVHIIGKKRMITTTTSKHNWSFDEIVINELVEQGKVIYL